MYVVCCACNWCIFGGGERRISPIQSPNIFNSLGAYQDNVHQQSSNVKLGDQSEQSEQALVDAPAIEDQSDLLRRS